MKIDKYKRLSDIISKMESISDELDKIPNMSNSIGSVQKYSKMLSDIRSYESLEDIDVEPKYEMDNSKLHYCKRKTLYYYYLSIANDDTMISNFQREIYCVFESLEEARWLENILVNCRVIDGLICKLICEDPNFKDINRTSDIPTRKKKEYFDNEIENISDSFGSEIKIDKFDGFWDNLRCPTVHGDRNEPEFDARRAFYSTLVLIGVLSIWHNQYYDKNVEYGIAHSSISDGEITDEYRFRNLRE